MTTGRLKGGGIKFSLNKKWKPNFITRGGPDVNSFVVLKSRVRLKNAPGRTKKPKTKKPPSISKLIKEADRLFSLSVRGEDAFIELNQSEFSSGVTEIDHERLNRCFTCKKVYPIKKLHCGHYLSRFYKAARWHEDNARPQCMMCNMWKRGDPVVFRRNLIAEIGLERVEAIEKLRDAPLKLTREYLEALIEQLKQTAVPAPINKIRD